MSGYELWDYRINGADLLRGMNENVHRDFKPKFSGENDIRLPVVHHVLKSIGFVSLVNGGAVLDEGKAGEFVSVMQTRIDQTVSSKALTRIYGGSYPFYVGIALGRLPARILLVAERAVERQIGQACKQITSGEPAHENDSLLTLIKDQGYVFEKGMVCTQITMQQYVDKTGDLRFLNEDQMAYYEKHEKLPPDIAEVQMAHPTKLQMEVMVARALKYTSAEVAEIAAEASIILQMRDSFINSGALASLESRGLISNRGHGRSQGLTMVEALREDFAAGKLCADDFADKFHDLAMLAGTEKYMPAGDYVKMLQRNLERRRVGGLGDSASR